MQFLPGIYLKKRIMFIDLKQKSTMRIPALMKLSLLTTLMVTAEPFPT
jgi:hypothetical protein